MWYIKGATAEVELVKGKSVKVTIDDNYKEKGSSEVIHVDYKNITKVVMPGNRVYVDDGLISLIAKEVGRFGLIFVAIN